MALVIICGTCGKRLWVPTQLYEKKIRGRVVTICCRLCGFDTPVDDTALADAGRRVGSANRLSGSGEAGGSQTVASPAAPAARVAAKEPHRSALAPHPAKAPTPATAPAAKGAGTQSASKSGSELRATGTGGADLPAGDSTSWWPFDAAAPPAPVVSDPDPSASEQPWTVHVGDDNRQLTLPAILEALRNGELLPTDFVWREGMADWQPIANVPELTDWLDSIQDDEPTRH
jgi:hypothetical protein